MGTCFVICKLRMISKANHWEDRAQGEAMGNSREREWYFIADFLKSGKRVHIFF